jgi:hypothetical protein
MLVLGAGVGLLVVSLLLVVAEGELGAAGLTLPLLTTPTPAPPTAVIQVTSHPAGAAIIADGREVGRTPAAVAQPADGQLLLRHDGYLDSLILQLPGQVKVPLWRRPDVQAVHSPLPGGAVAGVDVLADGRVVLDVTLPTAPNERQAWTFDPATSGAARIGPAVLAGAAPAGVAVTPDGSHTVSLQRAVRASTSLLLGEQLPPPDALLLDGPEGRRSFLADGSLVAGERVLDLTWPPSGGSALLLSQRPVVGGTRFRLRRVEVDGSVHDLVDLPLEPVEASWVWAADGQHVAFLVRATAPTLATLELETGALRSVVDLPNDAVPTIGGLAPVTWTADGALLLAGPVADDGLSPTPSVQSTRSPLAAGAQPKPPTPFGLYALPPNQATPHRLGATLTVAAGPAVLTDGSLVELARDDHDGTLLLRTLDGAGAVLTEQPLGLRAPARFSVRWDLAHGRAVMLLPAETGGIDVRILVFDEGLAR